MNDLQAIRDKIIEALLPEASGTGWSWDLVQRSAAEAGFQDMMAKAVFPDGLNDAVAHFSDFVDRKTMDKLKEVSPESLRVRDRIKTALLTRFDLLETMQAHSVAKASLAYWAVPVRVLQGQRVLWRSADRIWIWAGDTTQDCNRYTKRGLLSSLLMATTLVWLDDTSADKSVSKAFLERRLENIMEIGRAIGTIRGKIPDPSQRPRTARA